jgi:hypothetical protein
MGPMHRILSAAALALLATAWPAAARQPDTLPDRPFVRGGAYDKPYLTTLMDRAAIGGYAEFHARVDRTDGAVEEGGFDAKRFNIFTAAQISDFVRIAAELEIEEGGEELKLEFAAIDFSIHQGLRFRGGMLLSPLGRFNLTHDSPLNEFTDRPLVATDIIGTALSEPGLGALGLIPTGRRSRMTYEVYAVNGFSDGLIVNSPEGTRIPRGRSNFEDNNNAMSVAGRVTWSPDPAWEVGLSAHHGPYNVSEVEGLTVDDRRNVTITVVDFEGALAGFRAAGEAAFARVDIPPTLVGLFAERQRGAYVELLRDFGHGWVRHAPSSYFSVGGRLDAVDFDTGLAGDDLRQLTVGVNFRPTPDSVAKFNYVRGRSHDRFNNAADHASVQVSLATYF